MQRYYITAEATYEALRQSLNVQLGYPTGTAKSIFQTALQAPRDGFRRVLLAVDTDLPQYTAILAAITPLIEADAMEEIDEATYVAAVNSAAAGGGASTWSELTGTPTTLAGYGITDAATQLHTHTASQVSGLAAVATSGSAADLTGTLDVARIPSLPASQIGSGSLALARLPIVLEQTQTVGNSGTSTTLALTTGSVQTVTLSGNCTFTMPSPTAGASITLILTQGGTFTATFTGVLWAGGTAPTITATSNKRDILVFVSDGTNWFGTAAQNF